MSIVAGHKDFVVSNNADLSTVMMCSEKTRSDRYRPARTMQWPVSTEYHRSRPARANGRFWDRYGWPGMADCGAQNSHNFRSAETWPVQTADFGRSKLKADSADAAAAMARTGPTADRRVLGGTHAEADNKPALDEAAVQSII